MRWRRGLGWAAIAVLAVLAALTVFTTLRALTVWYTPVPVNDTWEGSFEFTRAAQDGFIGAVWSPHNEHRIVLTKLLFWFNNSVLGGGNAFLIVVNVVLTTAIAGALGWLTAGMFRGHRTVATVFALLSVVAAFSWIHRQNLIWEFQSQFYFAVLFALLAFGLAARASLAGDSMPSYAAALGCAVLAMLSMGAGIPAGVAFVVLLAALAAPRRLLAVSAVVIGILTVPLLAAALAGAEDTDVAAALTSGPPVAPLPAVLIYLGGPVYLATESFLAAQFAGGGFLLLTAGAFWWQWRRRRAGSADAMVLGGLAFVLVVLASAANAALFRAHLGEWALVGSRYQVLVLTGWVILLAASAAVASTPARTSAMAWVAAVAVLLVLLPSQLDTRSHPSDPDQGPLGNNARRAAAALGVELGVADRDLQLPLLYYRPAEWGELSEYVRDQQWAVFGGEFRELRETVGSTESDFVVVPCTAVVRNLSVVAGEPNWWFVRGYVVDVDGRGETGVEVPELVRISDPDGVIVGYGVTGFRNDEVVDRRRLPEFGDFRGYVLSRVAPDEPEALTVECVRRS